MREFKDAELEIIAFSGEDVIATSGDPQIKGDNSNNASQQQIFGFGSRANN